MKKPKTIFGKAIQAILSIFISNWPSFVSKLWRKVPGELQDKVTIGVRIVEALKRLVDSPVADVITSIIPGDVDDKVKDHLRAVLPIILDRWRSISGEASYHGIATEINTEITGMPYGQSALTTEVGYQALKKGDI